MNHLLFSTYILDWFNQNKRDLPWRDIGDPYKIWVSEVILQQTRVNQGTSYYLNFINRFPNIKELALANEDEVLKLWQGLGYYTRARNLHYGAKQIFNNRKNIFPKTSNELIKIKGIGEYTAAAIASIAFNENIAAIDGNVYRVLSRVFGIKTPIDTSKGKKEFKDLANLLVNFESPGDYNQAVMEFGAIQCKPKQPNCEVCIFKSVCKAHLNNIIHKLPVKANKIKQRNRYFNYIIIENSNSFIFKKRTANDIWKNMYDFPLVETLKEMEIEELIQTDNWKNLLNVDKITILKVSKIYRHKLTHQKITARFIHISINKQKNLPLDFITINKKNTFDLAVPKIIENYMTEFNYV